MSHDRKKTIVVKLTQPLDGSGDRSVHGVTTGRWYHGEQRHRPHEHLPGSP
jgi:hypothetical protein